MEEELKDLLQNTGDGIVGLFDQLMKGNWVDDQGHPVATNTAMLNMKTVLRDMMQFRAKHLGYRNPSE